ncbi:MAG: hypothetical protein LBE13_14320 [Bacteroidales bacterium]|jgi:hypothetical protein|nr:hypothetical protein [Bacteroidales bacterium]
MITRFIYPLWLRERITWRIKKFFPNVNDKDVSLIFDNKLKFDLSRYDVGHQSIIFNGYTELLLTKWFVKASKSLKYRGGY